MFLKKNTTKEVLIIIGISIYAFYVNWISGNIGVIPIDSFGFLDTGYSILNGKLPIRDFWIFTGLVVDYMEAGFIYIFGNNWNSHLIHSSFMNILATYIFYIFFKEFELEKKYLTIYCLSFATLCYPVSGTPFAYLHSYIFSLIAIMFFILAIKNGKKTTWFALPFIAFLAFFSMQTPSAFILLILFFALATNFYYKKKIKNFNFFIFGCLSTSIIFFLFLFITKTELINFVYQYILFPLSIGEGRVASSEVAYVSLIDQLNLKRLFGDFKFIHILFIPLIIFTIKNLKKKNAILNLLNLTFIFSILGFLFNQLITANQIYIFSLIPIIGALLHLNINQLNIDPRSCFLILFVVLFSTVKFHFRYNIDRKFHDLENIDKSKAINANLIHKSFKNLKWISKFEDPENEMKTLILALKEIKNDSREKTLITHYHFFSTFLDQNLNILNRWYLWDNNTHPTENHKYFHVYKNLVNKNIKSNNVKVIYLLGHENEILFKNVKNYFTDYCFKSKTLVDKRFSSHEIVNCKKIK